ncbi:MAG: type I-C CRISPR-associated protein Cas5 [Firmicutes bacterium]|nr:type I-C CRISPR-associated protein Cas5 [Bacillota bacterium]
MRGNARGRVMVKVGGDFACFSRPEFKVERVSYDVITPSAARGLLEAIFWRPEFRYEVREIQILKPVRQIAVMRNEISERQGNTPIVVEERRQQRTSLILKDVEYLICADMVLQEHATDPVLKYTAQFNRRIEKGQCFQAPYLGTREFVAWFEPPSGEERPIVDSRELGTMLFDMAFVADDERRELQYVSHGAAGARILWGYTEALFFQAKLDNGILKVPYSKYEELYRREGKNAQGSSESGRGTYG